MKKIILFFKRLFNPGKQFIFIGDTLFTLDNVIDSTIYFTHDGETIEIQTDHKGRVISKH